MTKGLSSEAVQLEDLERRGDSKENRVKRKTRSVVLCRQSKDGI